MRLKTQFTCQACGYQTVKWLGKCPDCASWNSFAEETTSPAATQRQKAGFVTLTSDKPLPLYQISLSKTPRYQTRISELDRVLGGGLVPGSLTLLGGDPGIGKSTLVLCVLDNLARNNVSVLYVTGEESREQIKLRALRLGISSHLLVVAENSLDKMIAHIDAVKPQVVVVDSIQTVYLPHLDSAPGSLTQVRECAGKLLYLSKTSLTATILVGHVTKEGAIAGPRTLEHMVDTVLYFEGETSGQFRILRTMKNRYGSTNEIGVFEMTSAGLVEVANPSEHFLSRRTDHRQGSCITASLEGTRPILTEIQALVSASQLANPRRTAIGLDANRLALIVAVLEKIAGINLYNQDIYVNAVGGLKLSEPAADLAIMMSLVSSFQDRTLPGDLVAIAEIGLTGELRPAGFMDLRIQEAKKLGYRTILVPKRVKINENHNDIKLLKYDSLSEVLNAHL